MALVERVVRIANTQGLHARPSAEFVKIATKFGAEITVIRDGMAVNGKSILGVMTLAAECGSALTVRAEGDDAEAAIRELEELLQKDFEA